MTGRLVDPWLLLLATLPLAAWLARRRRDDFALSSFLLLEGVSTRSWRTRLRALPDLLWLLALLVIVLAVARPQYAVQRIERDPIRRACMLLLDTSGSMAARDPGEKLSRLERMKQSVREAIRNSVMREGDVIGIVAVAENPRVVCPLTTDQGSLESIVQSLEIDRLRDRTNLGDAIALAVEALGEAPAGQRQIWIYSDGAHNVAEGLSRMEAARIAEAMAIPISAVALGGSSQDEDLEALRQICELTGGVFQRAPGELAPESPQESEDARILLFSEANAPSREKLWQWEDLYPTFLLMGLALFVLERLARWIVIRPLRRT